MIEIEYGSFPHARGHECDVVCDEGGVLRYRENKVVSWLLIDGERLNELAVHYAHGRFSMEDTMEVYRLIGYSLDGFEAIWHEKDPATRSYTCHGCDDIVARGTAFCGECDTK